MKNLFLFVMLQFVLFNNSPINAQWAQTKGPLAGHVNCLSYKLGHVFAGTNVGLFVSTNSGNTWTREGNGLTSDTIFSLAWGGSYLYAGTYFGTFRSSDYGASWTPIRINSLLQDYSLFVNGNYIYASTASGIDVSTDNGTVWTSYLINFWPAKYYAVAAIGANIFLGGDQGLYLSTNQGLVWTAVNNGINTIAPTDQNYIRSLTVNGSNIYAGTYGKGVFISTNNGTSWTQMNNGLTDLNIYTIIISGNSIFAGSDSGVFYTTIGGSYWSSVNNGLVYSSGITSLAINGSSIYAGTNNYGVYLSTNNGSNWAQVGLPTANVSSLTSTGNYLIAGTYDSWIFSSTNAGNNWTIRNNGLANSQVDAVMFCIDNLFSSVWIGTKSYIYASNDSGASWIYGGFSDSLVPLLYPKGSSVLVGGYDGISIFSYSGNVLSWQDFTPPDTRFYISMINVGSDYYAGTKNGVFLSTNNGSTWLQGGLVGLGINALAAIGTNIFAGTNGDGVYLSTNNGMNWIKNTPTIGSNYITSLVTSGSNIFAAAKGTGVWQSTNNGTNWNQINTNLGDLNINTLVINNSYLYAGSAKTGVWKRPMSDLLGVTNEIDNLPKEYSLSQNYPNPFNPSTTINYYLPKAGNIKLTVYNTLGSKVVTIVDGYKSSGNYSVQLNVANLASGIYFYKLESGSFSQTKKFILMK